MYVSGGVNILNPKKILEKASLFEGAYVAELGCGAVGHFTIPAAKMVGEKGVIYAVDVLKPSLDSIESMAITEGLSNIITVWSDIEVVGGAKKIKDHSCDIVLLVNVCYQLQSHENVMREALRMLKNKGKFVLIDWKMTKTPYGPPRDHRVNKDKLLEIARTLHLTRIEQFDAGKYHYGLVFEKTK